MSINIQNKLFNERKRENINKNFTDFRSQLLNYARTNFSDQIQDFSESSLGGMLLDFAATVGDSLSFYVDQQFSELHYETATNPNNIVSHLKRSGVKAGNASPSSVYVTFIIEVDLDSTADIRELLPDPKQLPIIKKETTLSSSGENNINFILSEDVDFTKDYIKTVAESDDDGLPIRLYLEKEGVCTSGIITEETVSFEEGDTESFLSYTLSNDNVHKIIKISDDSLNEYYEVEFLSQDTVYLNVENSKFNQIYPTAAPFRFVVEKNYKNNNTLIRFGNGSGKKLQDNILTNPEDFLIPLKNRDYNSSISLDPNMLIKSNSLGVSPAGSTLTIRYIHGGGNSHNVDSREIDQILNPIVIFPNINDDDEEISVITENVLETLDAINLNPAVGGTNSLSLEDLRTHIPNMVNSQKRIVNEKDLVSRIYTMPTNYGRVNKVAVMDNEYSNLSKDMYVICLDNDNHYAYANDALKLNLRNYINQFRLLGDSYNILDSPIYNFGIDLTVKVKSNYEIENVLDEVILNIITNMRFETLQINQAINVNDIVNIVLNTDGIANIITIPQNIVINKSNEYDFFDEEENEEITYSKNTFTTRHQYESGFIFPKKGGIFELKYEELDVVVRNG